MKYSSVLKSVTSYLAANKHEEKKVWLFTSQKWARHFFLQKKIMRSILMQRPRVCNTSNFISPQMVHKKKYKKPGMHATINSKNIWVSVNGYMGKSNKITYIFHFNWQQRHELLQSTFSPYENSVSQNIADSAKEFL